MKVTCNKISILLHHALESKFLVMHSKFTPKAMEEIPHSFLDKVDIVVQLFENFFVYKNSLCTH